MKKNIIWSNNIDLQNYKEIFENDFANATEEEKYEAAIELNNEYLCDERQNLNIELGRPIIAIADLGLWNGRRNGYRIINSGNISDCLFSQADFVNWFVDEHKEFRCEEIHHDGTNYIHYRVFKNGITEKQLENFKYKILSGTIKPNDIYRMTESIGKKICEVYGW